ncbi:MAG: protein kinase [Thermoleophilaceae bacterium]|nr:protein kinase [Thermoleophilaceae bacterium]
MAGTDLRVPAGPGAPSVSNGHEFGVVITLEPSEPSHGASRRLRQAVSVRASTKHPNLVRAWPLGQADGRLFVGLERPPHPALAERLAAAPLEQRECVRILDGLAAGAAALQERGLVPCDVTPENVLIHPSDGGILMDLGIPPELVRRVPSAQDSQLAFRSPEERSRGPIDPRSCVYSAGAVLFAALTGIQPADGVGDGRPAARPRKPPLPSERRADLTPRIDEVVARAMARDPSERYPDVGELARAATTALALNGVPTSAPSSGGAGAPPPPSPYRGSATRPQRNGRRPESTRGAEAPQAPHRSKLHPAHEGPRSAPVEGRTRSRASEAPAKRARVRRTLAAVGRGCADLVVALVAVAVAAAERFVDLAYRFARGTAPATRAIRGGSLVNLARRSAEVARGMPALMGRVPGAAARRCAELAAGVAHRARGRALRRREVVRHSKPALFAVGALAACALAGTAIGGAMDAKEGPSFVARSGMAVQLPPGWEEAGVDAGSAAISPAIAAAPSEHSKAGLVVGSVGSEAAAERLMEAQQRDGQGRTPVRLGSLYAWRYAGLRPRPHLMGAAYVVPTTAGAVLLVCHASRNEAGVRLDECGRAATTLRIRGERPRPLSGLGRWKERLIDVIATLRLSRSEAQRRLAAADRPRGQARAATALKVSYLRAAGSLEGLPPLESGRRLDGVSGALRDAAAACGRLAAAAESGRRSAYREASHDLVLQEEEVRRELARASGA